MSSSNMTQDITSSMTMAFYNLEKNDLILFGEYFGKIAFNYCGQTSKPAAVVSGALGSIFISLITYSIGILALLV
jgi:hypothetical protein